MFRKIANFYHSLPTFVQKFVTDFIETGLATLGTLSLAFPATWQDLRALLISVGIGLLGALISAGRRAVPGAMAWLKDQFNG